MNYSEDLNQIKKNISNYMELLRDEINDNSVIDLNGLKNRLKKEEIDENEVIDLTGYKERTNSKNKHHKEIHFPDCREYNVRGKKFFKDYIPKGDDKYLYLTTNKHQRRKEQQIYPKSQRKNTVKNLKALTQVIPFKHWRRSSLAGRVKSKEYLKNIYDSIINGKHPRKSILYPAIMREEWYNMKYLYYMELLEERIKINELQGYRLEKAMERINELEEQLKENKN